MATATVIESPSQFSGIIKNADAAFIKGLEPLSESSFMRKQASPTPSPASSTSQGDFCSPPAAPMEADDVMPHATAEDHHDMCEQRRRSELLLLEVMFQKASSPWPWAMFEPCSDGACPRAVPLHAVPSVSAFTALRANAKADDRRSRRRERALERRRLRRIAARQERDEWRWRRRGGQRRSRNQRRSAFARCRASFTTRREIWRIARRVRRSRRRTQSRAATSRVDFSARTRAFTRFREHCENMFAMALVRIIDELHEAHVQALRECPEPPRDDPDYIFDLHLYLQRKVDDLCANASAKHEASRRLFFAQLDDDALDTTKTYLLSRNQLAQLAQKHGIELNPGPGSTTNNKSNRPNTPPQPSRTRTREQAAMPLELTPNTAVVLEGQPAAPRNNGQNERTRVAQQHRRQQINGEFQTTAPDCPSAPRSVSSPAGPRAASARNSTMHNFFLGGGQNLRVPARGEHVSARALLSDESLATIGIFPPPLSAPALIAASGGTRMTNNSVVRNLFGSVQPAPPPFVSSVTAANPQHEQRQRDTPSTHQRAHGTLRAHSSSQPPLRHGERTSMGQSMFNPFSGFNAPSGAPGHPRPFLQQQDDDDPFSMLGLGGMTASNAPMRPQQQRQESARPPLPRRARQVPDAAALRPEVVDVDKKLGKMPATFNEALQRAVKVYWCQRYRDFILPPNAETGRTKQHVAGDVRAALSRHYVDAKTCAKTCDEARDALVNYLPRAAETMARPLDPVREDNAAAASDDGDDDGDDSFVVDDEEQEIGEHVLGVALLEPPDAEAPSPRSTSSRATPESGPHAAEVCASCGVFIHRNTFGAQTRISNTFNVSSVKCITALSLERSSSICEEMTRIEDAGRMMNIPEMQDLFYRSVRGIRLALYKKYVSVNGDFIACNSCFIHINKSCVPPRSIADGMFSFATAGMPTLSPLEQACIAPYRLYATTMSPKRNPHSTVLQWQACCFEHDAPERVAEHLRFICGDVGKRPYLDEVFDVALVGTDDDLKAFKERALVHFHDLNKEAVRVQDETIAALLLEDPAAAAAAAGNDDAPALSPLAQLLPAAQMRVPVLAALRLAKHAPTFGEFWPITLRPHIVVSWLLLFQFLKNPHFPGLSLPPASLLHLSTTLLQHHDAIIHKARLLDRAGQDAAKFNNTDTAAVRAIGGGIETSLIVRRPTAAFTQQQVLRSIHDKSVELVSDAKIRIEKAAAARRKHFAQLNKGGAAATLDQDPGGRSPPQRSEANISVERSTQRSEFGGTPAARHNSNNSSNDNDGRNSEEPPDVTPAARHNSNNNDDGRNSEEPPDVTPAARHNSNNNDDGRNSEEPPDITPAARHNSNNNDDGRNSEEPPDITPAARYNSNNNDDGRNSEEPFDSSATQREFSEQQDQEYPSEEYDDDDREEPDFGMAEQCRPEYDNDDGDADADRSFFEDMMHTHFDEEFARDFLDDPALHETPAFAPEGFEFLEQALARPPRAPRPLGPILAAAVADHIEGKASARELFGELSAGKYVVASRKEKPANDYDQHYFAKACPWLFPTGSVHKSQGTIGFYRKLLLHHSGAYASCHRFILLAANRMMRMATSRAMTRNIQVRKEQMENFLALVRDDSRFANVVELVRKSPSCKEGKELWKMISPMIRIAGGSINGTPEQRGSALREIFGLTMQDSTPSFFFTACFDDVNNDIMLRFHRHISKNGGASRPLFAADHGDPLFTLKRALADEQAATLFQHRSANASATPGLAAAVFQDLCAGSCERECIVEVTKGEHRKVEVQPRFMFE